MTRSALPPLIQRLISTVGILLLLSSAISANASELDEARQLVNANLDGEALLVLQQLMEADENNYEARLLHGVVLAKQGRIEEAELDFDSLIRAKANMPQAYNNLAAIHASRGNFEKARQTLLEATQQFTSYPLAHENLGDLYMTLAAIEYQRNLQLIPENPRISTKLAAISDFVNLTQTSPQAAADEQASAAPDDLATEVSIETASENSAEPVDPEPADPEPVAKLASSITTTPSGGSGECLLVGPFSASGSLDRADAWFADNNARTESIRRTTTHESYLVYLPETGSMHTARALVESLKRNGIRDVGVIGSGDHETGVSLGVYRQQASVARRVAELQKKGYDAETQTRTHENTYDWLEVMPGTDHPISTESIRNQFGKLKVLTDACS